MVAVVVNLAIVAVILGYFGFELLVWPRVRNRGSEES